MAQRPAAPRLIAALGVITAAAAVGWWTSARSDDTGPAATITLRDSRVLTVALTGDIVTSRPLPAPDRDAGYGAIVTALQSASLAIANLDQNILSTEEPLPPGRWPAAPARAVAELRRAGIGVISCANNHALDHGVDGLQETRRQIARGGLLSVGCGDHLAQAREPAVVGDSPRRVAVLAVAVSASAESRATVTRGDIRGRPGVSALRYSARITADPATFAALRQLIAFKEGGAPAGNELVWQGTVVAPGAKTMVEMIADESDVSDLVGLVSEVRRSADVVIVAVHSHEPENLSEQPAELFSQAARRVIDAGARVVVGHGPHQVRGIEVYHGGVIFYSLGDFVFDQRAVDGAAADPYEAGLNLYQEILGAGGRPAAPGVSRRADESVWWESVVPFVSFGADGHVQSVRVLPIDLGAGLPAEQRGIPRQADAVRAAAVLERLARLSAPFNTRLRVVDGVGILEVP